MKPNPKKFQFMILGKSTRQSIILNINNVKIRESSSVVLLGLTIDNLFINSQFNYASIIWMVCHKQDYLKIEKIQYKALKIVYNNNESYEELLLRNNEVSIHQKQLRILATEVFKSLADVNPDS